MLNIEINPKYQYIAEYIRQIPNIFEHEGVLDYSGRNVIKIIEHQGLKLNIKSFKPPHLFNRFIYTNFRPSKAKRSFVYANMLVDKGINTPEPIAYIEEKKGLLLNRSFYICIHEQFDGLMREFHNGELHGRESLLTQFAQFTAQLHQKQIVHIDYSPGNILYKQQDDKYIFYLVDLNRMIFGKDVSMQDGCHNLRKLFGNEQMIRFVAQEYAKARGFDIQECTNILLAEHTKFWAEICRRHPTYSPYSSL